MKISDDEREAGINAARRYTEWYLGDPSWGSLIVPAFLNPQDTNDMLNEEMNR